MGDTVRADDAIPLLDESVPVEMPDLPPALLVTDPEQYKAVGDPTRQRIIAIVQHRPATAKQIADRMGIPPGTVGHHLAILERAGLVKVAARRLVRGIVARYYVRTARIFNFDLPSGSIPPGDVALDFMNEARDELIERARESDLKDFCSTGFPHARLTDERAQEFADRLMALIDEFAAQPPAPDGRTFGLFGMMFLSPGYRQDPETSDSPTTGGAS